jgi:hypothetical protein
MRQIVLGFLSSVPLLIVGFAGCFSLANDSSAELSVGGLVFTKSDKVALESEDLRISPDIVTVHYRFLNQTSKAVTLTIAFPLPDIDLSESENYSIPYNNPANFLGFKTKVDGRPVNFIIHQRAFLGTKDVSEALRNAGVPLLPIGPEQTRLADVPEATRDLLIPQGLLLQNGTDDLGRQRYEGAWTNVRAQSTGHCGTPLPHQPRNKFRYRASQGAPSKQGYGGRDRALSQRLLRRGCFPSGAGRACSSGRSQ